MDSEECEITVQATLCGAIINADIYSSEAE